MLHPITGRGFTNAYMAMSRRSIPAVVVSFGVVATILFVIFGQREDRRAEADLPGESTEREARRQELSAALRALAEEDANLRQFYEPSGYAPLWVNPDGWTERGEQAVVALRSAGIRGLRAMDYTAGLELPEPARLEAAVTSNLMRYAADIRTGRWNPNLYKPADIVPPPSQLARAVADDPDGLERALSKLDPPFAEYKRLETALAGFRKQTAEDPSTAEKIEQVERTLERWRWLPHDYKRGPILVNLPEFQLRAFNDKLEVALEMKVVVGQLRHPTPLFLGSMKYVVFGPYWNVPASILRNELIPDVVKDPTYFARNGYEVVDSAGSVVTSGEVSDEVLEGMKTGKLRVRQVPGSRNALGKVKFMFPNDDNIYLHDTNAPSLFARDARALSHGCVRVSEPQKLAEWVLRDESTWPVERIVAAMKQTKQQQVNLKDPIPVLMVYHTVTVSADGTVSFHKDLYGRDKELKARIAAAR